MPPTSSAPAGSLEATVLSVKDWASLPASQIGQELQVQSSRLRPELAQKGGARQNRRLLLPSWCDSAATRVGPHPGNRGGQQMPTTAGSLDHQRLCKPGGDRRPWHKGAAHIAWGREEVPLKAGPVPPRPYWKDKVWLTASCADTKASGQHPALGSRSVAGVAVLRASFTGEKA